MKIGLTGSIACGKTTVSGYLQTLGYAVVDADAISHTLTAPGGAALPALRAAFGHSVFAGETLDRQALGRLVFSNPDARERLNALLHPMILDEIRRQLLLLDTPNTLVFGDIPLLYECHMADSFDRVWVLSVPRAEQIARLKARDHLSEEEAIQRIDAQMPLSQKEQLADAVIRTDGPIQETRRRIRGLLTEAEGSLL